MFADAYRGRKVLVTGHTGFKGSWLTAWLLQLGAEVAGLSVDVPTSPANFDELGLGARIKRVAQHIDTDRFMVTYGDGVSDIDIDKLVEFHKKSGKIGTFTGVRMPSRFGAVQTDADGNILSWQEKPVLNEYINCGFFVFKREFLDYLDEDESCDLEKQPLERLAADGQLSMYPHEGFWECMDTLRDWQKLNAMWDKGSAPWAKGFKV